MFLRAVLTSVALPSPVSANNTLASHLRTEWIQASMVDPCAFHATMFSASVSIDSINGVKNNSVTIYHQAWVIRLLNERLTKDAPLLDYSTLGSVIPLLYYNVRYFRTILLYDPSLNLKSQLNIHI